MNQNQSAPVAHSLVNNSQVENDEKNISNLFNSYFVNMGKNLADGLSSTAIDPLSYLAERRVNCFYFFPTNSEEICTLLTSFKNKKSSLNIIPIIVLKQICHIIGPLIAELFNQSIAEGVFPEILKLGRVTPLHKAGVKTSVNNF